MQHEASICSAKVDENSFSISLNMQSLVEFAVGNTCNLVQAQIPAYLKNLKAGASNKMLQELFGIGRDTIKSHRDLLQIPSPICHRYGTEEVDRVLYEWSRHMVKNPAEKASESILKVSTAARVRVSICWSILKRQNKV